MLPTTGGVIRTLPSSVIYQPVRIMWRYFIKLILISVLNLNQVVQPSPIESQRVVLIQQPQPVLVPSPSPSALRTVFSQVRMIVSLSSK
jgi:hypothetical protein